MESNHSEKNSQDNSQNLKQFYLDESITHPLLDGKLQLRQGVEVVKREEPRKSIYFMARNPIEPFHYLTLSPREIFIMGQLRKPISASDLKINYFFQFSELGDERIDQFLLLLMSKGFLTKSYHNFYQSLHFSVRKKLKFFFNPLALLRVNLTLKNTHQKISSLYPALRFLFHPLVVGLILAYHFFIYASFFLYSSQVQHQQFEDLFQWNDSYALGILVLIFIKSFHTAIHELFHGLALVHFKRHVNKGGLLFYLGMPMFYVDTSDIVLKKKWPRIAVSMAGVYGNFVLSSLAAIPFLLTICFPGTFSLLQSPELLFFTEKLIMWGAFSFLMNLNPLVNFDGYYVLCDYLGIKNLRQKAFKLFNLFVKGDLSLKDLKRKQDYYLLLYAYLSSFWIAITLGLLFLMLESRITWLMQEISFPPQNATSALAILLMMAVVFPMGILALLFSTQILKLVWSKIQNSQWYQRPREKVFFFLAVDSAATFLSLQNRDLIQMIPAWIGVGLFVLAVSFFFYKAKHHLWIQGMAPYALAKVLQFFPGLTHQLSFGLGALLFLVPQFMLFGKPFFKSPFLFWNTLGLVLLGNPHTAHNLPLALLEIFIFFQFYWDLDQKLLQVLRDQDLHLKFKALSPRHKILECLSKIFQNCELVFEGRGLGKGFSTFKKEYDYLLSYEGEELSMPHFQTRVRKLYAQIQTHLQKRTSRHLCQTLLDHSINQQFWSTREVFLEAIQQGADAAGKVQKLHSPLNSSRWGLSKDQWRQVRESFTMRATSSGETVVTKGETGLHMYLIEKGTFQVLNDEDQTLAILGPGEIFGERALLYGKPRDATVRSMEEGEILSLDKQHFDALLELHPEIRTQINSYAKQQFKYTHLLKNLSLFSHIPAPLMEKLVESIHYQNYAAGEIIVEEGEVGEHLFIIKSGEVDVYSGGPTTSENNIKYLSNLKAGEHFGEVALFKNIPRQATVKARKDTVVLTLHKSDFQEVFKGDNVKSGKRYLEKLTSRRLKEKEMLSVTEGEKIQKDGS